MFLHLIRDVDQEQSADKHGVGLTLFEVFLQRRAELFRIFHKLLLALLDGLLSGRAGDKADDFVDSVEQLLNGTCDFSARCNIEYNSVSSGIENNSLYCLQEGPAIGDLVGDAAQDALERGRLLVELLECVFSSVQAVFYHCRFSSFIICSHG